MHVTINEPTVAIVVPIKNKRAVAEQCLRSLALAATATGGTSLVVIDHASTDGTLEVAQAVSGGSFPVLELADGFVGRTRNIGARAVPGEWLLFVDGDCVVPMDFVARLRAVIERTEAGAAGCEVGLPRHAHWIEDAWDALTRHVHDGPVRWLNSGCFAVRRDHFEAIGGFDETRTSAEDVDICNRLRERGVTLWQASALEVEHHGNPKTISNFYRRLRWHGEGVINVQGRVETSPTLYLVFFNALALLILVAVIIASYAYPGGVHPMLLMTLPLLPFIAPGVLLTRALLRRQRHVPVVAGLFLLQVMLVARLHGLVRAIGTRQRRAGGS